MKTRTAPRPRASFPRAAPATVILAAAASAVALPPAAAGQGQVDPAVRGPVSPPLPAKASHLSLRQEIERSVGRGLAWLKTQPQEGGYWGSEEYPALTALVLWAEFERPGRDPGEALFPPHVQGGLDFLLGKVQSDGGIYGKGLASYNTAISMNALMRAGRDEYDPVILGARRFLINQQSDFDVKGEADNTFDGGIGYGSRWAHSDLSNTHLALEGLYYASQYFDPEQLRGPDLDWGAAIAFVQRCQNLPGSNPEAWASSDPANRGGFIYFPGSSMAGEQELPGGKVALRSYGSMSYAGLLSFIYAGMKADDPRVAAVLEWLGKNFSLEENPGMGAQGLFYYYHTMAKALSISGIEQLVLADGTVVDWRRALALKLFDLQHPDGTWVNESGRWWEKDPVLVTAYAVLTLENIHRALGSK